MFSPVYIERSVRNPGASGEDGDRRGLADYSLPNGCNWILNSPTPRAYAPIHGQPLRRSRGFHTWENQLNVSVQEVLSLSLPISVNHPHHVVFLSARKKKKSRLPRKRKGGEEEKKKKKKCNVTISIVVVGNGLSYAISHSSCSAAQKTKGEGSCRKGNVRITNSCRYCELCNCEKIVQFFERRFVLKRVSNKTLLIIAIWKEFLLLSHSWWQTRKTSFSSYVCCKGMIHSTVITSIMLIYFLISRNSRFFISFQLCI